MRGSEMALLKRGREAGPREQATSGGADGPDAAGDAGGSRARRVSFRVLAVLTSLWVLAVMIFGLMELVLMWLPGDMLVGLIDDFAPADLAHRAHFMSVGVIAWALLLGVLAQLRRPARSEAPMLHALAIAVGASVVHALSGTVGEWLLQELTLLAPLLALALLHPRARELARLPQWDRDMATLALVGAGPWLFFAVTQAQHQWRSVAGDSHAEMEHWATAALLALLVVACALIGSTSRSGWRLTAWIAALASVNYGLHSLVFPEPASAASAAWAIAAIAWGLAYAAAIIRRTRLAGAAMSTP